MAEKINFNDPEFIKFHERVESNILTQRSGFLAERNEVERALSGQLMLITTVLLSASVIVLGNDGLMHSMTTFLKQLMLACVILLLASIFSGVRYYFAIAERHYVWARAGERMLSFWNKLEFKTHEEASRKISELQENLPDTPDPKWRNRQITFLGLAAMVYVGLLGWLLF